MGTSGSGGGGGGTDARWGGGGGWCTALAVAAAGVGRVDWETLDWPGRGCTAGFGLAEDLDFCDGPPALRSLPAVMGRTIPGFLFAGGRDTLFEGSPVGTWMVWLLYISSFMMVSSLMALI